MEVKESRSALLSNFEVHQLLQEARTLCKKQPKKQQKKNLATIVYETTKYLDSTPCKSQTSDNVQRLLTRLKEWPLTKAEKLQLLNQRPENSLELQLLIEECVERLTEDQEKELLEIIKDTLPPKISPPVAIKQEPADGTDSC